MDDDFMTELRVAVEDAKKMLTVRPSTNLLLRYEDKKERVEVTREEFEAATSHLVTQTVGYYAPSHRHGARQVPPAWRLIVISWSVVPRACP